MLHLSTKSVAPPGGFRFHFAALALKDPTLAWVGPFHTFDDLMNQLIKLARANELPPPTPSEVEDQLCHSLPSGYCKDELHQLVRGVAAGSMSLTLADVTAGTRTLLTWWRNGKRRVDDAEAMHRAHICNTCPFHVHTTGCTGCSGGKLREMMGEIIANHPLPTDAMLDACGICKCGLKGKVRMLVADILPAMPKERQAALWEKCWIREVA